VKLFEAMRAEAEKVEKQLVASANSQTYQIIENTF